MKSLLRWVCFLSIPLFALDYATKEWAVQRFPHPDEVEYLEEIQVIPGVFHLHRLHNTGMSFGIGNNAEWSNWVFGGISVFALLMISIFWVKGAFPTLIQKIAGSLLISGILGNVFDRLTRGYVVDFLQVDLQFMVWPSFNVADAAICVAAALLIISSFIPEPRKTASS